MANNEEKMNSSLAKEKVISPKEFFDIQIQQEKTNASYKAYIKEQMSEWQMDLIKYKSRLSQCEVLQNQLMVDAGYYEVKAPITGLVQGIHTHYPGSLLQANEAICFVSPEGDVVAECYVSSRDIGFIRENQQVYFQVDAFDYNFFGVISGRIITIDNDYTLMDGRPVFKIRCTFDSEQLNTKKGQTVQLRKGLTVQARFIIGQRTIWQLLFDKMDDWINPSKTAAG
jgi:HlyD family secretion protein